MMEINEQKGERKETGSDDGNKRQQDKRRREDQTWEDGRVEGVEGVGDTENREMELGKMKEWEDGGNGKKH